MQRKPFPPQTFRRFQGFVLFVVFLQRGFQPATGSCRHESLPGLSVNRHASVHGDELTRDVAACRGGQEVNDASDLFGLGIAAQRDHTGNGSHILLVRHHVLGHIGEHITGGHGVDRDAIAGQLVGHDAAEMGDSGFQGAVHGIADGALDSGGRGQIDDAVGVGPLLAALLRHLAGHGLMKYRAL